MHSSGGARDLTLDDFRVFQGFLSDSCGIVLDAGKQYLIKNRLGGLLRDGGYGSLSELARALKERTLPPAMQARIVDAMTTHETSWFRDPSQFDELRRSVFSDLAGLRAGGIRIWSAACSSGQEPYSLSICAEEWFRAAGKPGRTVQIIGTDVSEAVLEEGRKAVYSDLALGRGLDENLRNRYFQPCHGGLRLIDGIAARVRFQQFNLLKPFSVLGKFDLIFCRNVLIYFSDDIKRDIVSRFTKALNPGGYLFLSSTEALPSGVEGFDAVRGQAARYYRVKS